MPLADAVSVAAGLVLQAMSILAAAGPESARAVAQELSPGLPEPEEPRVEVAP
jgi:hypothetical protein